MLGADAGRSRYDRVGIGVLGYPWWWFSRAASGGLPREMLYSAAILPALLAACGQQAGRSDHTRPLISRSTVPVLIDGSTCGSRRRAEARTGGTPWLPSA